MVPRKSSINETVESIFFKLSSETPKTITDLVRETKYHHNTIRSYLELIEYIQSQPKLILERTGHSYQVKIEKN
ncbi:hypothetical protein DSAG12_04380 [Promethearchaeum syntrophicum]|uniref:Uncharacterized protein n=1 Tax=Promethearchaeum syntrophicum TaxID=2594042 RepID=A0AC61ZU20_9ARCH